MSVWFIPCYVMSHAMVGDTICVESVYVMHSLFCHTVTDDDGAYICIDGTMCIDVHVCLLVRICWQAHKSSSF